MIYEVKEYFGLDKTFASAGYFETENYRQTFSNLKEAIGEWLVMALVGVVGSGKTTAARRIKEDLKREDEILVSTCLATDKSRIKLNALTSRLFSDLAFEKGLKIPANSVAREDRLQELIRQRNKPILLFIDEAHDLRHGALTGLKELAEIVQGADGVLSVILIGHPRLKTDLETPFMEEIGGRANIFELDWIQGRERDYLEWALSECCREETRAEDIFTEEAVDLLSQRLSTPLQINNYSWKALESAYLIGQKPVNADTVNAVISKNLNDMKARIWRYGYDMKSLCEAIDARPSEVRAFLRGRLGAGRSQELNNEIMKLGIAG